MTTTGNKVVIVENRLTFGLMPKFRELPTGFHNLWWFEHLYSREGKETKSEIDRGSITNKVKNDDGFQLAHGKIAIPSDMVLVWRIKNPTLFTTNFRMKDATLRLASEIETFLREEFRNAPDHASLRAIKDWGDKFKKFLQSSSTIEDDMGIEVEDFKIGDIDLSIIEQKAESAGVAAKAITKSIAECYNEITGRSLSADLASPEGVSAIAMKLAQDTVQGQTVDFKKIQTDSGRGTMIELNEGK
ncbi:MAG: hypothetical protein Q7R78_01550 [bacterium]|nr:hypothetical protein [bacterium]